MGISSLSGATPTPPGLVLVTTSSFSAASSVSVDDCFTSEYDNYHITLAITGASGTDTDLSMRLRVSSTDSSTSYNADRIVQFDATVAGQDYASATSFVFAQTATARPWAGASLMLFGPALADETVIITDAYGANSSGQHYQDRRTCCHNVTTAYDGFTILSSSGTITGSLAVYGYRKAT